MKFVASFQEIPLLCWLLLVLLPGGTAQFHLKGKQHPPSSLNRDPATRSENPKKPSTGGALHPWARAGHADRTDKEIVKRPETMPLRTFAKKVKAAVAAANGTTSKEALQKLVANELRPLKHGVEEEQEERRLDHGSYSYSYDDDDETGCSALITDQLIPCYFLSHYVSCTSNTCDDYSYSYSYSYSYDDDNDKTAEEKLDEEIRMSWRC